jgi:hypothetical protein
MNSTSDPVWTQLGPGYAQVQFYDLKNFVDYLYSDLLDFGTYIWRGQRCDSWKLEPTLDRLIRDAKASPAKEWDFAQKHLEAFKHATRGRRGVNPPVLATEDEWWALGQHQGLATPLLDWTTSPFVAAFFAFSDLGPDNQTEHRAVFALHQPSVVTLVEAACREENRRREVRRKEIEKNGGPRGLADLVTFGVKAEPELVFVRPLSDENQRLVAQGGLFTRSRTELSIDDWVSKHHSSPDNGLTLLKCLVPDYERARCLQLLNRMNINPSSLFPDLSGASRYCNLHSEIENY